MSDSLQFDVKGLEELTRVFQTIEDGAFKKRKVKMAERKAGKIYLKEVQRKARNVIDDNGAMADSFGILRDRGSKEWITTKYGAKTSGKHKASRRANGSYRSGGWLAHFYDKGTKERQHKKSGFFGSAHRTGKIERTNFQKEAFDSTKMEARRVLNRELRDGLEKAIKIARRKGMRFIG